MGRHGNTDVKRAFVEYQDSDTPSKCNKVRCLHCGFVRAKNTTRQIEHLQECQNYLNSPEATVHLSQSADTTAAAAAATAVDPSISESATRSMLNGTHPNPNLQVHRRGPNQNKRGRDSGVMGPPPAQSGPSSMAPSLTAHLLSVGQPAFLAATQQPFLSHAGCGTLSAAPLTQWLVQDGHCARGYVRFIGQLLAKIRLPAVQNSQFHPLYRTVDLLISALNNVRREMQFFEITATKYGLQPTDEPPTHVTRAYLDLFVSASSPGTSLLEGMVLLWATEHCKRTAWLYAASYSHSLSTPSTESHIVALHQSLIPNWTAPSFSKFVDACRTLVDELANSTTSHGKEEMHRCEQVFQQICWLEERFWPDVDGMGEEDETSRLGEHGHVGHPTIGSGMGPPMGAGMGGPSQDTYRGVLNGVGDGAGAPA